MKWVAISLSVVFTALSVYVYAEPVRQWMMMTIESPSNRPAVTVVDGGKVCLYVVTSPASGGWATGVWGIQKSRLGGQCQ